MARQTTDHRPTFTLTRTANRKAQSIRNPQSEVRNERAPGPKRSSVYHDYLWGQALAAAQFLGALALVRFRPSVAAQLDELLRFAEHRQRLLRLRVCRDQVAARFRDAEHRVVDLEADHRADEVDVLLERVLVDPNTIRFHLLAEVGHHRVVDDEVRLHGLAARRLLRDARVALGGVLLRVVGELRARVEHAAEASGIEALERPRHARVRLDAAAAVDRPARIGALQIARVVRPVRVLIPQRVAQILVEARVPRPLNQAAARRIVVRRRQRESCVAADAIHRLYERLAERRLADDVG